MLTAGTLAYPLIYSAILSLYETNPATLVDSFVGLRNYADLFASDRFLFAIVRTAFYALTSSFAALVIGLVVALCIHHLDFRYKSLLLGLLFVPWVMSPVEVALIGKWMVHPIFGPLNHALVSLGVIPRNTSLLGQPATALATITAVYTGKHVPFVMVVLYAALQTLPKAIYEAGRLDGAGSFGLFWHLTLPLLRPIMVTTFLLIVIWQFGSYAVFDVMTGGGPRGSTEVLSIFIVDRFTAATSGNGDCRGGALRAGGGAHRRLPAHRVPQAEGEVTLRRNQIIKNVLLTPVILFFLFMALYPLV